MLGYDYADILCRQCEIVSKTLLGEKTQSTEKLFSEISKRLTKDFLPPIEREDIAAISYALLCINAKAQEYSDSLKGKTPDIYIKKQTDFLSLIVKGLLTKKKTCGDDIRRLVDMNIQAGKLKNGYTEQLNDAIADFIKITNSTYFKNL